MKKAVIFLICLLSVKSAAQNPVSIAEEFSGKYREYFSLNSETLYLHLNQNLLLPEENIWFAVYSFYNEYGEPSRTTNNVHVAVYDEQGNFKGSKIIFAGEGTGSGYFELDPENYPPGKYFIRAKTRHMDNFDEDLSYIQEFHILEPDKDSEEAKEPDLMLMPEAGSFIAGIENTVGLSLIDSDGNSYFFTGKVINQEGKDIQLFRSSLAGMAKVNVTPEAGKTLTIEVITPEGYSKTAELPVAQEEGLALSFERTPFGEFVFKIKTNEQTFQKYKKQPLLFAVHQEGNKLKTKEFFLQDGLQTELKFSRRVMFPGTNIISVFNAEKDLLLERLVFNSDEVIQRNIKAKLTDVANDSVEIQLSASNFPLNSRLSLSVMPAETKAYRPDHNLISAFLMRIYTREGKLDAAPFFKEVSRRFPAYSDLDLFLLMQGKSGYSWNKIFSQSREEKYKAEAGFTIEGRVKDKVKTKKYKLAIMAPEQNLYEFAPLQKDGSFELSNLFLIENTPVSFSLVNQSNEKTFRPALDYKILPKKIDSDLPAATFSDQSGSKTIIAPLSEPAVELDTVPLAHQKKPEASRTLDRQDEELKNFRLLTDYLRNKGFLIHRNQGNVLIFSKKSTLEQVHGPAPIVTVDGVRVPSSNLSSIVNLSTDQITSIEIKKSGAGLGIDGGGGLIAIEMRKNTNAASLASGTQERTTTGFAPDKPFASQRKYDYSGEAFSAYAPLGWFPDLKLENGKARIKIPVHGQPGVRLFVEGMTAQGEFISEEILLMIPDKKI